MPYFVKKKLLFNILITSNEEIPAGFLIKIKPLKFLKKSDLLKLIIFFIKIINFNYKIWNI